MTALASEVDRRLQERIQQREAAEREELRRDVEAEIAEEHARAEQLQRQAEARVEYEAAEAEYVHARDAAVEALRAAVEQAERARTARRRLEAASRHGGRTGTMPPKFSTLAGYRDAVDLRTLRQDVGRLGDF